MIKPFADDDAAASIGDLSIENGTSSVSISGQVVIARDAIGLERARELKRLADELVAELESGTPAQRLATNSTAISDEVPNPFV